MIRDAVASDADAILAIYNHYVANTTITFEEEPVSAEEMRSRIDKNGTTYAWLVWEESGRILGYAYAGKWRERSAYRFSAETSVYVDKDSSRRGIGRALYAALLPRLRAKGVHTVLGGITLPNEASVALHESMGFAPVARLPEVGYKFGRWLDVGYWALKL
ncbi:MAG: arsinothricin resistance N-acetyltransferase ArsN1 family B [Treponemataceae bacterium]